MALEWHAQIMRYTVFKRPSDLIPEPSKMWLEALGSEPDEVQTQVKRQLYAVEAVIDGIRQLLQIGPERIDWIFQPTGEAAEQSLPELGTLDRIRPDFLQSVRAWLNYQEWPKARRVAVGMVLFAEADNLSGAQNMIMSMEPSLRLAPNDEVEDLLLQINRPQVEVYEGQELRINRLTKWSAIELMGAQISLPEARLHQWRHPGAFTILELDVNTPALGVFEFSPDSQRTLVERLFLLADEIMKQGDVHE